MNSAHAPRFGLLTAFLVGAAVAGMSFGAIADEKPEDAAKPCVSKKFATAQVEKACKDGGQAAAKKMMKDLVKKAKANGEEIKCKSCHVNLKDYKLTDDGLEKLKKLL